MNIDKPSPRRTLAGAQHLSDPARLWAAARRTFLWLGIALTVLALLGALYQAIATRLDRRSYPPPGQLIDVGGYRLHLNCTVAPDARQPVVILEQGGGGNSLAWFLLQPEVARAAAVCAYDRAGMGWSEPGPAPRDGRQIAAELQRLLHNAGLAGPYVLVGHSFGGLYVRAFAAEFPQEVAGLVLLDATHPDIWTRTPGGRAEYQNNARVYAAARWLAPLGVLRLLPNPLTQPPASLPPERWAEWRALFSTSAYWAALEAEYRASPDTMAQLRAAPALPEGLPLAVVTAGNNTGADGNWAAYQAELAALSTNSVHTVVAGADHVSLWADPQYVAASSAAILQVVEAVHTGQPLAQP
ncbi:MAG TPA: alpha/beta fold hydrolase [Streptosporangiaceae bacterium]